MQQSDFTELLHEWHKAENDATEAEMQLARIGQLASDPRVAELAKAANEKRERADRLLAKLRQQASRSRPSRP
ncbi:MAG TPA: hypothetical protein VFE82_09140 [Ramlibacter sp.]|jgi:hypothetical protein|uniref:hypothetical protein n=1 Tax=Ramlibacter sp. TaxID=1917967 RepID=UPI002D582FA7|nr:hypothetical protein [Ramlibacter sp.]HZY18635.1 hypothetical protein [Ramlibacter sp.]